MLSRGFIEVTAVGFKLTRYIAIEHIIQIKSTWAGTNNVRIGEITLSGAPGAGESSRVRTKETPEEIMILINKERELIRAMENVK